MALRNLLEDSSVFTTIDLDEARRHIGAVLRPHVIRPLLDSAGFAAVHRRIAWSAISVHYLEYGAAVEISAEADPAADAYLVSIPIHGTGALTVKGPSGRDIRIVTDRYRGVVINPRIAFRTVWAADTAKVIVRLDAGAVRHHLELMLQRRLTTDLVFAPRIELSETVLWWRMLRACTGSDADTGAFLLHPPLSSELERFLMTALLVTHQHNHSALLPDPENSTFPPHLRAAIDQIGRDPVAARGVAEVAAAAGVSIRTLQEAFAVYLHTTPSTYLRRARLWRARTDLLGIEPRHRGAVTEVATRWGFTNLGRFAQAYHAEFGEHPSETVRKKSNGSNSPGMSSES